MVNEGVGITVFVSAMDTASPALMPALRMASANIVHCSFNCALLSCGPSSAHSNAKEFGSPPSNASNRVFGSAMVEAWPLYWERSLSSDALDGHQALQRGDENVLHLVIKVGTCHYGGKFEGHLVC